MGANLRWPGRQPDAPDSCSGTSLVRLVFGEPVQRHCGPEEGVDFLVCGCNRLCRRRSRWPAPMSWPRPIQGAGRPIVPQPRSRPFPEDSTAALRSGSADALRLAFTSSMTQVGSRPRLQPTDRAAEVLALGHLGPRTEGHPSRHLVLGCQPQHRQIGRLRLREGLRPCDRPTPHWDAIGQ